MNLRPYQHKAVTDTIADLSEVRSALIVMPTGTGKTVVFGHIAQQFAERGQRVLVIAHRQELIHQAVEKVERIIGETPDVEMGSLFADMPNLAGHRSRVVVATVQTLSSGMGGKGRMNRFGPNDFNLIIIDEAHHAIADSYRRVIEYFTTKNPAIKVLGVTATPDRTDEEALGKVFDRPSFVYEIGDGIHDGWLVPITQRSVTVAGLDYSAVRTTAGDLNGADLAGVMEFEANLHGIAHPTYELAAGRKTLVFAHSVAQAERIAEILNRHKSNSARFVCGTTDDVTRKRTLRDYRDGAFQFLVNCAVFTEGFDEPSIELVSIAKPTKSRSLYAQMVGRGTRPLPSLVDGVEEAETRRRCIAESFKPYLEVLDFVGNAGKHKLVSCADVLGGNYDEQAVELAEQKAQEAGRQGRGADMQKLLEESKEELEHQRLEAQRKMDESRGREAANRAKFVVPANYSTSVVSAFDALDIAPVQERGWDKGRKPSEKMIELLRKQGVENAAELSFRHAGQLIAEITGRWGKQQCSWKQAKTLKKYGYPGDLPKKEAKKVIDALASNGWRPLDFDPLAGSSWGVEETIPQGEFVFEGEV